MADDDNKSDLAQIRRDIFEIRKMLSEAIGHSGSAESEIPEMMRRFANYFHDVVHIKGEYVTLGIPVPEYINTEIRRCDDRFRQLLEKLNTDGATFEQVRREMADDPSNRWDHTRLLTKE